MTIVWLNDVPIEDYGIGLTEANPWDAVSFEYASTPVIGQIGSVVSPNGFGGPRTLTLSGILKPSSVANRRSLLDRLNGDLSKGLVEIRVQDDEDRFVLGRYTGASFGRFSGSEYAALSYVTATLSFVCDDPTWQDRYAQSLAFGATRTEIPLGRLPSWPLIYVEGATNPTIRYRSSTGDILYSMGLTVTVASDEALRIDMGLQTIDEIDSGVRSNGISYLTSGDFFAVDPGDGDPDASSWPTLEITSGSAVAYYRRRWS